MKQRSVENGIINVNSGINRRKAKRRNGVTQSKAKMAGEGNVKACQAKTSKAAAWRVVWHQQRRRRRLF